MKTLVKRKRVTIPFFGLIVPLGISGPVDIPTLLDITTIGKLVMRGYKVIEVFADGSKIELNAMNYEKELGPSDAPAIVQSYEAVAIPVGHKNDRKTESIPADAKSNSQKLEDILISSTFKISNTFTGNGNKSANENIPANKTQVTNDAQTYSKKNKHKADSYETK